MPELLESKTQLLIYRVIVSKSRQPTDSLTIHESKLCYLISTERAKTIPYLCSAIYHTKERCFGQLANTERGNAANNLKILEKLLVH